MTRLIDADKLCPDCMTKNGTLAISQSQIANAPTVVNYYTKGFADGERSGRNFPLALADEEKAILVRQWRPHGEWIEHYDTEDGFTWLTCSRCMFKAYEEDYNFCPNCGADMRGGSK